MEFMGRSLSREWEEQWRQEKEKRKRITEEGKEGIERDNRELWRIVAYNDSRMGLKNGKGEADDSQFRLRWRRASQGGTWECSSEETLEEHGYSASVHIYRSQTYPNEVFVALKDFLESSTLTDLTLTTASGSSCDVHSLVLGAVSPYVGDRLREGRRQGGTDVDEGVHKWSMVVGPEVDHVGLQAVLQFAYTGVVILSQENLPQIKAAARGLGVLRLLELCNKEDGPKKVEEKKISAIEEMAITFQSIGQLWADRVGCDVTLDVEGTLFHVHRVVLAASSDYFRGMFTSGMRESYQACVSLPFQFASELEVLIRWSYSGMSPLSWDNVFEITCTAIQLQFLSAVLLSLEFMRQEMEAGCCLDVVSFAEAYGMSDLLEEANDFVLRNFSEVSATAKFCDLDADKLLGFLCCDGLCVPSELAVFRAVVTWILADPGGRLGQAASLMKGVRFPLMTFREFREVRAINLRMECFGDKEVELYSSALKEFGFSLSGAQGQCRVRCPKDALILVGGDQLNPDVGPRLPSRELWFAHSLRSGTGLVKTIEWRRLGEIPDTPKFRHGIATLGGRLYVVGGCYFYAKKDMMKSTYSYDPANDSWKKLADMREFRSNFAVVAHEQSLYAIGGDKEVDTNVDSVEVYSTEDDSWSFVQPLDQALSGHAVTATSGGIFISGGFNSQYACLLSMFQYHPERGSTHLAPMNHDRAQHCMEALHGRLYVAGGVCNLRKFYTDQRACEVYNPPTNSWETFVPLPVPHVGAASAILEDRIYILGGYCQEDYRESGLVHRFDPNTLRWENVGKLPGAVTDVRACLLRLPQHLRR